MDAARDRADRPRTVVLHRHVAYQAFAEHNWGRIIPGASADLVWLDQDPRSTPALELPALTIRATYLRGESAFTGDTWREQP